MGLFSLTHAGCSVLQTNMPHSAKDTQGKPQQSFDSSSCTSSLLFITAAHTRLSTPFHSFFSFPDRSKVLICQGRLPAPPAVTRTFRAGVFPCAVPGWDGTGAAVPGAPGGGGGGPAGDRRLLRARILAEPLVFQAGIGSGRLATRFSSARMFAALS